ncbi:amidohydrolase family protein [Rhabdothermincola salaria]|uniref:amidohydrolase family protein n=1 Tax=Rhabdothermincola salaria TaxID=2903142 RepID=UPI001E498DB0|nr:amidohydrolase family protein [Rhabdothermincola salaria]MCD9622894.1 amidohydrolase family protein [Rhabdothermincola salaria]
MSDDPVVIVSADCHIGPRLEEDLRPLCPPEHLAAFDAYVADGERSRGRYVEHDPSNDDPLSPWRNQWTPGHHDPDARRRDLDFEGIAAEVVFHGSQNNQPIPFQTSMLGPPDDPELAAVGIRIYNTWLAEMCAAGAPRHIGLAHLPMWDVDAAVAEVRWAAEAGLRGINFPAPRTWLRPYNDRAWEPLWEAAEELSMPLTTHSGAGDPAVFQGPELVALMSIESGGWFSRRAAHLLVFAGVFERHPDLKLVLTEQPGEWWPYLVTELDTVHMANTSYGGALARQVPKRPSEYLHRNVFIGASFLSRAEAHGAVRDGYADRVMWGSDYPHMESTFQVGDTPYSLLSLRHTFADLPEDVVRAMVGGTAIEVYGLDASALAGVASAIGAPTHDELTRPLEAVPAGASPFAFRTVGPWA